ncbi:MAG: PepSY domain-containing protein [Lachnospiraceae bacterium]|nr:PepSY domain-containing protein [Lachnospiraceae bacterium]
MTEQKIEDILKSGFEKITPNVLDSVLKDCKEQSGQAGKIVSIEHRRRKNPALRFAGIAAALVLLVGAFLGFKAWQTNGRVASVISLDVNPSVEIRTNKKEKVLEVIPLNEDGRIIMGGMDFEGSNLDVTVNALVGSMLRNGYLSELANSILISIDNDDPNTAAALEQKLMGMVSGLLGDAKLEGAVLGQVVNKDQTAEDLAKTYGISVGKARLIEVLMAADPKYKAEELSGLTINELNNLYAAHKATGGSGESEPIDSIGKASTRAYIGEEAAAEIALKDAGLDKDAVRIETELDWEDGCMVYDVDLEDGRYEYEYEIDARTGEILSAEKELLDAEDDDDDDHGEQPDMNESMPAPLPSSVKITKDEAKQIALQKAGLTADKVTDARVKLDVEDGKTVYEVEFLSDGFEYEITIDAETGEVLEYEREEHS